MVHGSCKSVLVLYFILDFCKLVLPSNETEVKSLPLVGQVINTIYNIDVRNQTQIISLFQLDNEYQCHLKLQENKTRFKRQGKYTEAAKMGQTKLFRLQMQLIKNAFVRNPVGAVHPLHESAATIFMRIVKEKLIAMFSPDVTVPPKVST